QPRRGLDRRTVADRAVTAIRRLHAGLGGHVLRRLTQRLRTGPRGLAGPEGGVDTLAEVEVQVPGLEVLEEVRDVHRRAVAEVALAEVGEAERLEVDDPRRPERRLLRRGEAE